jgi:hypothetical protein
MSGLHNRLSNRTNLENTPFRMVVVQMTLFSLIYEEEGEPHANSN